MMEKKIVFSFDCNGDKLVLTEPDYGIVNYEGIEATDYEMITAANINHMGERMKRKKILSRPISVEFDYLGSDEKKIQKRQELIRFFSPFRSGVLTIHFMGMERVIEYEVTGFKISSKNVYDTLSCLLELTCLDPMFRDVIQTGERISTWIGGWKWKFKLPFRMKQRGEPKENIINYGHVETPIEIEFHGPAVNPKITNLTTGEVIRIKRELTSDDILYINTAFRKKRVEIIRNGVREDAFDYIDLNSKFFSLLPGDNIIEYQSENDLMPQSVQIYYYNRYIGV